MQFEVFCKNTVLEYRFVYTIHTCEVILKVLGSVGSRYCVCYGVSAIQVVLKNRDQSGHRKVSVT